MSEVETIQEIAFKLMLEQNKNDKILNGTTEKTIFVLGSKGVGKSTMINNFLDKNEPLRTTPTLAIEYSYAKRTNSNGQSNQKLIGNIWELGSLANSNQLIDVPIKSHGSLENFSAVIMLNLAEPDKISLDLEAALQGLKNSFSNNFNDSEIRQFREKIIENEAYKNHPDIQTLEIMPCQVVILGGMYDQFENLNSEIKRHVIKFLRSISHTIGSSLIFYSSKIPSLAKTVRDIMSKLAFNSPLNPIRIQRIDYNEPIMINALSDTWEKIGVMPSNSERISIHYNTQIKQNKKTNDNSLKEVVTNPTNDVNFREAIIDDLRAMKDEELLRLIKHSDVKIKFDSFNLTNSPFNYLN
ncbi:hypothetical protein PVAND_006630 [Polypedilum vanderplanki]|uniref:Cytoplasmic dynein 2 light intermediate chain 1 n=1 Tax=Polypedilum vanderplanki TaxID=319348 RepID=A0A9J6C495_POLVA|nr:hypothetical protein PVAND_006630 [Polypedilum vanderplanki]